MSRVLAIRFALSLVAILILGQVQCAAACVSFFSSQAANTSVPPCHRHHDSKHSGDSSDACSHEISASGVVAQLVPTPAPQLTATAVVAPLQLAGEPLAGASESSADPPGSAAPFVLRI